MFGKLPEPAIAGRMGAAYLGDSLDLMARLPSQSVDLIVTSPPFGLVRKKDYGNEDADSYVDWFLPFGRHFMRLLKPEGSLVIDIGGAWKKGQPTRSLYHFKLLIALCEEVGFHLAQEFYWWNPSKLPTPAEWVNIRRIRVKDAVNSLYWLSPSPYPKASNRRVLYPYSDSMQDLFKNGYKPKLRPSGHDISTKFGRDNGAAIPPNLIGLANTESNGAYLRYCQKQGIKPHPARFPAALPEYFIRMLSDTNDVVLDPFAGSCVTGEVCEALQRNWICIDLDKGYLDGAKGRFLAAPAARKPLGDRATLMVNEDNYYKLPLPYLLWNGTPTEPSRLDGGRERKASDPVTAMNAPQPKPRRSEVQSLFD